MRDEITDDTLMTTQQVADLLQCTAPTIINWANAGKLAVLRTDGGHRRIRVGDLIAFLRRSGRPVPLELLGARRRLLLIEDHPQFAKSVVRWFKKNAPKVVVEVETSPIQGLMTAVAYRPHLVLIDMGLPEFDGFVVHENLRQHEATKNARLAFCTGQLSMEVKRMAEELGTPLYGKPLDHQAVLTLLETP